MPLISPLTSGSLLRPALSNHMICFTPESVLHPFYPTPIRHPNFVFNVDGDPFPSATHLVAQMAIKFADFVSFFNRLIFQIPWRQPKLHGMDNGANGWARMLVAVTFCNLRTDSVAVGEGSAMVGHNSHQTGGGAQLPSRNTRVF